MRLAGFLVLVAGWAIVVTAAALFTVRGLQGGFALAGVGVEALGWSLVVRSHAGRRGKQA